jgi:reverse gyrase
MNNEIRVIVELVLKSVMGKKKDKIEKIMASIDEREGGILVYLSHGATLGEAEEIQEVIKSTGLQIPEQIGNAVIYVTKQ